MARFNHMIPVATVAALVGSGALAQTTTVFDNASAASDSVTAIADAVRDDMRSGAPTQFGTTGRPLGSYGSISATATGTSGNTDTANLGIGVKFGTFDGLNGHDVNLSYTLGESAGTTTANKLMAGYDYTRVISNNLYGYGQLRTSMDEFSSYKSDTFLGFGVGYAVINERDRRWQIQAGPGYRSLEDNTGVTTTEGALSLSSKYYQQISDGISLSNDTDILYSETDTRVLNDLGVNVSMGRNLALRTSLQTEYHTDPLPGLQDTDNTLGVSVVYTFN